MDSKMYKLRFAVLVGMILAAAASRLIPHPLNFTPIGAMALFGGACFADRRFAFAIPLAAMLLSDVAIALVNGTYLLHSLVLMPVVYGSLALIVCLGVWLRERRRLLPIAGTTLAASVLFFVLTNFGEWALGPLYAKTWEGLVACYVAAIPFFQNTLLGDAVYVTAFFGGLALVERFIPRLREDAQRQYSLLNAQPQPT